jgi:hypothetical protein
MSSNTLKALSAMLFALLAIGASSLTDSQWAVIDTIVGYNHVQTDTLDAPKWENGNMPINEVMNGYGDTLQRDTTILKPPKPEIVYRTKYVKIPCPCEGQNEQIVIAIREAAKKLGLKRKDTIYLKNSTTKLKP